MQKKFYTDHFSKEFEEDLKTDHYHIFSLKKAKQKGFYTSKFPDYDLLSIDELSEGDRITIRAFFNVSLAPIYKVDSGLIDLEIEAIDDERILANILTELPKSFPFSKGTSIELFIDEIIGLQKQWFFLTRLEEANLKY